MKMRIVIADESEARLYDYHRADRSLELLERPVHEPESVVLAHLGDDALVS